jgi:hypothetical protein
VTPDLAREVRRQLGSWASASVVTERRGSRVSRLHFVDGAEAAVKAAEGAGPAAVLPRREAAVIEAVGPAAGVVLGQGWLRDGGSWLATPWWQGPTLADRCSPLIARPDSRDARRRAAAAAAAAARAVAALHARGWAHGDLQAGHVVHTSDGVRLLDLAWAHNPGHDMPEVLDLPYAGALVHLEPPEIAAALLDDVTAWPTATGDVYTLAAAVWTSCTGRWPLDYAAAGVDPAPGNPASKRRAAASRVLRPTSDLPWPALAHRLHQVMSGEPDLRPSAAALADELDTLIKE